MATRHFSKQEVRELIWNNEIDRQEGENGSWSRSVTSVVEADDGKFYSIDWEEGCYEYQENDFYEGNYPEVEKKTYEKTITISEWVNVD